MIAHPSDMTGLTVPRRIASDNSSWQWFWIMLYMRLTNGQPPHRVFCWTSYGYSGYIQHQSYENDRAILAIFSLPNNRLRNKSHVSRYLEISLSYLPIPSFSPTYQKDGAPGLGQNVRVGQKTGKYSYEQMFSALAPITEHRQPTQLAIRAKPEVGGQLSMTAPI